jgi:hypothetical protein
MAVTGLTVALGLLVIAFAIWMLREQSEAARNVPIVAGPLGILVPLACVMIAIYILVTPFIRRGLPTNLDLFGNGPAATQTAIALLPTATPTPTPTPQPAGPVPTPDFEPFWVSNFRRTQMWSGRPGPPGVVSFGVTSDQFCVFQVVRQQNSSRLYVLNPYDDNYFWIDAEDVGPLDHDPEHRPGPKPTGQNCSDAVYDG